MKTETTACCDHMNIQYEITGDQIRKFCDYCDKSVSELWITDEQLSQEELKTIYKILEGTNVKTI